MSQPHRDEVWLVALDSSRGSEIRKTRPCLIASPDEMNDSLQTLLVAPMTSTVRSYPTRVSLTFRGKSGQIALDQLRAVDQQRLVRRVGYITAKTAQEVSNVLVEMFVR